MLKTVCLFKAENLEKPVKNLWFLIGFSIFPDVTKNVASMISKLKPVDKLKKKRVQNCVPKMYEK